MDDMWRKVAYFYVFAFIAVALGYLAYQCATYQIARVDHCYLYSSGSNEREWKVTAVGKRSALLKAPGNYSRDTLNVPLNFMRRAIEVDCSEELEKKAVTRCDDACKMVNLPLKREELDNQGNMTLCICGGGQ